jgi:dienelactone hydrolase
VMNEALAAAAISIAIATANSAAVAQQAGPPAAPPADASEIFQAGFRSFWALDPSRRYDMKFADGIHYAEGGGPRPVLVNLWYPAAPAGGAKTMEYAGYLPSAAKIEADAKTTPAPRLAEFAQALTEYDKEVIAGEVFGKKIAAFTAEERAAFDAFLAAPTAAARDAPEAAGRFSGRWPLVLYHAGYGSSVEDQSRWCERLASSGYVVVGSAYPKADGTSFNIDAHEGSLADFAFLVELASHWPNVDATRIAGIGHSGGAHTMLRWRVSDHCPARAIVSLDTTQDYYSVRDMRWGDMIPLVLAHPERATGAILMAANPYAPFELIETLTAADRWYFTAPLDHEEFIGHGLFRLDHSPEHPELVARTRACHEALFQFVRAFLDAELRSDRKELDRLAKEHAPLAADGSAPHVEHAPVGDKGPFPYEPDSDTPPTPRQLRPLLAAEGIQTTLEVLRRVHESAPHHPIFDTQLAYGWTYELAVDGKLEEARALHDFFKEIDPDYSKFWFALCEYDEKFERSFALASWKALIALEPENGAAKARLKLLEGLGK